MHFVSRKAVNIETFFCDLSDFNILQIRDKKVVVPNLETSAKLICISMDDFNM